VTSAEFEKALKVRDAHGVPLWAKKDAEIRAYAQEWQYAEFCALNGIDYAADEEALRLAEIVGVDVADVQRVFAQPDELEAAWIAWATLEGFGA
jgi:hypothetical protein